MATNAPTWETSKENAAPLQRGRNVATLEQALGETEADREAKKSHLHTFENLVRPSEEMAETGEQMNEKDDPILHWMSYIKFHQDCFPSDKQSTFLLMERCTRALVRQKLYANDVRFIRICAMYADQAEDPGEIFKYLFSQKVGTLSALFWIAWAFWTEKQGNFQKAEKIFNKGLSKKAKPLQQLELRYKQFQRRMARRIKNQAEAEGMGYDEEEEEGRGSRGILGSLSEEAFRRNDRSFARHQGHSRHNHQSHRAQNHPPPNMSTFIDRSAAGHHHNSRRQWPNTNRGGNGSTHNSKSNTAAASTGFQIYHDGQENDAYNLDQPTYTSAHRRLAREEDRRKENTLAAEKWNQRGGLHSTSHYAASAPSHASRPPSRKSQPFSIHVDEECAAEHQRRELQQEADEDRRRRHRDERTFRPLEVGDSVAEKLYHDPLRYMKDPSQRSSDEQAARHATSDTGHQAKEPDAARRRQGHRGFDKSLLQDSNGQEQCFIEPRAIRGHFKLVSSTTNFNLLRDEYKDNSSKATADDSRMSIDDNTTTGDLSMEDATNHKGTSESPQAESHEQETSRKVLFRNNASFEARDRSRSVNVSTASSTVNEAHAVGIYDPEEETINTKLAMKEMSMMFCSPAIALTTSCRKAKRSKTEPEEFMAGFGQTSFDSNKGEANANDSDSEDSQTATYTAVMNLVGSCNLDATNNSIIQGERNEVENQGPKNPLTRVASSQEVIDEHALKPLHDDNSNSTACRSSATRRAFGSIAQENPLSRAPVNPLQDDPGFQIFSDNNDAEQRQPAAGKTPFGIHEDDVQRQLGSTFTIFEDGESTEGPSPPGSKHAKKQPGKPKPPSSGAGFQIFEESKPSPKDTKPSPVADTAKAGKGSSKQQTVRPPPAGFLIFQDTPKPSPPAEKTKANVAKKPAEGAFSIFVDAESSESAKPACADDDDDGDGDTATLSLFGGLVDTVFEGEGKGQSSDVSKFHNECCVGTAASALGHEDRGAQLNQSSFTQRPSTTNNDRKGTKITDPNSFGDISMIEPFGANRNLDASPTMTMNFRIPDAIDYNKTNRENRKAAMRQLKEEAAGKVGQNASLIQVLSAKAVFDVSNYVLPRIFKRKLLDKGSEIKIGTIGGTVKRELGRGAYGIVVLMDIEEGSDTIAVKAQALCDSLAHEFTILKKIENRIKKTQAQHFPYPTPMSFVSLADGGLMSMTAASESGLNLVDLVNAYQEKNWRIDDVIVLHYMARMLHHLEDLHWHGKILHCDVKPDNWVLCSANNVKGSDLMLVDYGRAVDLSELANGSNVLDVMDVKLLGEAADPDMMCVAMRKQRPWSFDADTFGLCASVHVLLFGNHIEIVQNANKRWMPRQSLKRYWQKDLWTELFDQLLNLDEGTTIGSRPRTLRILRKKVETRLDDMRPKLDDLLRKQEQILWSTRPQLQPKRKR